MSGEGFKRTLILAPKGVPVSRYVFEHVYDTFLPTNSHGSQLLNNPLDYSHQNFAVIHYHHLSMGEQNLDVLKQRIAAMIKITNVIMTYPIRNSDLVISRDVPMDLLIMFDSVIYINPDLTVRNIKTRGTYMFADYQWRPINEFL